MDKFPHDVWYLYRKLFHRFLKYRKYFIKATKSLPEYKNALVHPKKEPANYTSSAASVPAAPATSNVVSLLSSSEGEVSSDSDDDGTQNNDDGTQDI